MSLTRNRNSKRLRSRAGNGRFQRATLENTFGWTACGACGRFYECTIMPERTEANPFPMPERVTKCPHCGAESGT